MPQPEPSGVRMGDALAQLYEFAFQVPALMGLGDHWPLTPMESKALGKATEGVIRSTPQRSRAAAVKAITRWLPWVSLTTTAYVVCYPRILQTRYRAMAQREARSVQSQSSGGDTGAGRVQAGPDAGVGRGQPSHGPYAGVADWSQFGRSGRH